MEDLARTPAARPASPLAARTTIALLAAAFLLCAGLDQAGVFSGLDQFAVSHLMPSLRPSGHSQQNLLVEAVSPIGGAHPLWLLLPALWTYPCSVLLSGLIALALLRQGWRAGAALPALMLTAAWLAGNLLELLGKGTLRRPALYGQLDGARIHIAAFDGSFPSGHMLRGTIVAAMLIELAPQGRRALLLWWALIGPALVVSSAHTPSDVLGGLLAGLVLVGCAARLARSPALAHAAAQALGRPRAAGRRLPAPPG